MTLIPMPALTQTLIVQLVESVMLTVMTLMLAYSHTSHAQKATVPWTVTMSTHVLV